MRTTGPEGPTRVDRGLEAARDLLRANLDRTLSVARLAEEAGLSTSHFARAFRRAYGLPPQAFHRLLRVRCAQRLIDEGQPLADVAASVGFADQSHLTRVFRSAFGWTPGEQARRRPEPAGDPCAASEA